MDGACATPHGVHRLGLGASLSALEGRHDATSIGSPSEWCPARHRGRPIGASLRPYLSVLATATASCPRVQCLMWLPELRSDLCAPGRRWPTAFCTAGRRRCPGLAGSGERWVWARPRRLMMRRVRCSVRPRGTESPRASGGPLPPRTRCFLGPAFLHSSKLCRLTASPMLRRPVLSTACKPVYAVSQFNPAQHRRVIRRDLAKQQWVRERRPHADLMGPRGISRSKRPSVVGRAVGRAECFICAPFGRSPCRHCRERPRRMSCAQETSSRCMRLVIAARACSDAASFRVLSVRVCM